MKIQEEETMLVVELSGELDHHRAKELRQEIDEAVLHRAPDCLTLDFKEITFMDSSGIGLVMGRYKLMQSMGGTLCLRNMNSHIRRVMVLAGLDRIAVLP